jgi:hypothetical protein
LITRRGTPRSRERMSLPTTWCITGAVVEVTSLGIVSR